MERGMRGKINAAVADVEAKYHAGDLPWNWATVRSLIGRYPVRRQLDVIKPGWEDEATPDPDGVPWDPRRGRNEGDDEGPLEGDDCQSDGSDAAECGVGPQEEPGDVMQSDIDHHGHGDDQEAKVGVVAKQATSETELSAEQAESLLRHSGRLQSLQKAKDIFDTMGGAMGASLKNTVNMVMGTETKKFRLRMRGDAVVAAELRTSIEAEEDREKQKRAEFQAQMQRVREKKRLDREMREVQDRLTKSRKEIREAQAVVAAKEHIKSYSLAELGEGKKNGGGVDARGDDADAVDESDPFGLEKFLRTKPDADDFTAALPPESSGQLTEDDPAEAVSGSSPKPDNDSTACCGDGASESGISPPSQADGAGKRKRARNAVASYYASYYGEPNLR